MIASKRITFLTLLVLLVSTNVRAQWKNIAPNLVNMAFSGCILYNQGILWAGSTDLWSSADSGRSWQKSNINFGSLSPCIYDIAFFDKYNGLVATSGNGLYLTRDGGQSWTYINRGSFWKVSFNGSQDIIHGCTDGAFYTSTDGGTSWRISIFSTYSLCFTISKNGIIYALNPSSKGTVSSSSDLGLSWKTSPQVLDVDCYTISSDSCDPNRLYLLNENAGSHGSGYSQIDMSTDGGSTWVAEGAYHSKYYLGALSNSYNAIFAASRYNGIMRSIDRGLTWKSIDGPDARNDSRSIACVNDNMIFVLDNGGNIWSTSNCGGDSIVISSSSSSFRFSSARIINDSQSIIVHLPIYSFHSGTMSNEDVIMHYPTLALKYQNGVTYNGKSIDVVGSQWPGRAALHFDGADLNAAPDSLAGYANFIWTPLEYACDDIIFDSISAQTSVSPCSDIKVNAEPFQGIIGSYKTCGLSGVADNSMNTPSIFTFSPNPAGDYGMISSLIYYGTVTAKLYDISGRLMSSFDGTVALGAPMKILLRDLASGVYHLSIRGQGIQYELSFVHQ